MTQQHSELIERIDYILEADGVEATVRRSHLTAHDLRQCKAALQALQPAAPEHVREMVERLQVFGHRPGETCHEAAQMLLALSAQVEGWQPISTIPRPEKVGATSGMVVGQESLLFFSDGRATHWMPLLQQPKGE